MSFGTLAWEQFEALTRIPGLVHGFTWRQPGVDVAVDRAEAVSRLEPHFADLAGVLRLDPARLRGAEQIHGAGVAVVRGTEGEAAEAAGVDGLVTAASGCGLRILVADCCAVFLVDPVARVLGLVHSGAKGTRLGIARVALETMAKWGAEPQRMVAQLSPCIGPPHYEVDFAAQIRADLAAAGVPSTAIHGPGANTGADLARYYSYRQERGKTGRMLALLGWGDDGMEG